MPTGKKIEKKLNEVLVNYNWSPVSDYSGSMFKEMKKLISDLLTTQKDSFIKIIESKKEDLIHHDCLVDKNTKCDCGADKWLDNLIKLLRCKNEI